MVEYEFDTLKLHSGNLYLRIIMKDPRLSLVEDFLESDVGRGASHFYLEWIDQVLNGEEPEGFVCSGNVCMLTIRKDVTAIEYGIDFGDEQDDMQSVIDTRELRELIVIWRDKVKEFYRKK